jgi:undecaprenyl-diphosphatase
VRAWIPLDIGLAAIGILLTVLGLGVGALNGCRHGWTFDRAAFRAINRLPSLPALDWLMWSVTHLGSAWSGVAVLGFAMVVRQPRFGIVTALALLTVGILIGVTKALTQRARPFTQLADVRVIGLRPADLSYPSGHSTMAFSLATLLAHGLPMTWPGRILLYLLATSVGYSRLHLGVHFPLDILSGAVMGTGWGLVWASYLYR